MKECSALNSANELSSYAMKKNVDETRIRPATVDGAAGFHFSVVGHSGIIVELLSLNYGGGKTPPGFIQAPILSLGEPHRVLRKNPHFLKNLEEYFHLVAFFLTL